MNRRTGYLRATFAAGLTLAALWAFAILLTAWTGGTLGYDYRAYDLAVDRLLAGRPLYDLGAELFGPFGTYFYPPPFAMLMTPFAILPFEFGVVAWTAALVGASILAVWLMPVPARVRWIVLLLATLSWPLVYAVKLGQVGPLLLLLFALGWRWLDRPWPLGLTTGLGTIIKIQPAVLLGWALLTGRRRAAAVGVAVVVALAAGGTVVAGIGAWLDEATLLAKVSQPVLTPHQFGAGRLLFEAGVPEGLATVAHYANLALVALVALVATLRATPTASFIVVAVASQLLSPVLWDHYALVLLLPTAWLLARGHGWAVLLPLATTTVGATLGIGSPWAYLVAPWVALVAVTAIGLREAGRVPSPGQVEAASSPRASSTAPTGTGDGT